MWIVSALLQADPGAVQLPLRGWDAIQAVDGWLVALVGMSVVFSALFLLFLLMILLQRLLEPRVARQVEGPSPVQPRLEAPTPDGLSPRLVVAIATAIRLEQQRQAAYTRAPEPGGVTGWKLARSLQWASHQRIYLRHGR